MPAYLEVQHGRTVLITTGIRGSVTIEYVDGLFSATPEVTGKHVDDYRALDQAPNDLMFMDDWGRRRLAVYAEKAEAFDAFAAAEADKKRLGDIKLMCDIMKEI